MQELENRRLAQNPERTRWTSNWISPPVTGCPVFCRRLTAGGASNTPASLASRIMAITEQTRITNAPSLYALGAASQIAPDKVERFLETNWPAISGLFTKHGPWEGFDTKRRTAIKYQTTAHTLALILGGIGSAPDNMRRYLEFKGLYGNLLAWYAPGNAVDFLSPETQIVPWTSDGSPIHFSRDGNSIRIEDRPLRNGRVTLTVPQAEGINLSGGELIIRYRASVPIEHAVITLARVQGGPYVEPQFPQPDICAVQRDGRAGQGKSMFRSRPHRVWPAPKNLCWLWETTTKWRRWI